MMRICVSIVELDADEAARAAARAVRKGADLVEVRFDIMPSLPEDLSPFKSIAIPKIATLRTEGHGGRFSGDESTREVFYRLALHSGFDYVDIEMGSPLLERKGGEFRGAKVICSHHDLGGTPSAPEIVRILSEGSAKEALPKAAFAINSCKDLLSIADAARSCASKGKEFVLTGMGELGALTRVRADWLGCAFTYASLEKGKEAAPGQVDLPSMRRLTPDSMVMGIVGDPVSHSRSPPMHNAALVHSKIPGIYLRFPVKQEELEDFLQVAAEYGLRGFNITIPHKETIIPLLDRVSPTAEKVGAVNTVVIEDGKLIGHNTDLHGVEMTFKDMSVDPKGKRALLVGAGGSAHACCAFLSGAGADVSVYNRTRPRAEDLAERFPGCHAIGKEELLSQRYEIVVNCTPVGMRGFSQETPVPPAVLRPGQFVMDAVYNPPVTELLVQAERAGARTANGERMLVHQAMKSFHIWTGRATSYSVMAEALMEGSE